MRVLIAHCRYQLRGGEDAVVDSEAELLRSAGHDVELLLRDNADVGRTGTLRLAADAVWSRAAARDLERRIRAFRPDLIHVHNTMPLLSPAIYWAAARRNVPVVQTLHNFRLLCPQAMLLKEGSICESCVGHVPWRAVRDACYRDSKAASAVLAGSLIVHRGLGTYRHKVTRYIALNAFCRDKFIAGGLPAHKLVIKPNFVADPGREQGLRQGALFVGRLSHEKGVRLLREAVELLPNVQVDVIGTGPQEALLAGHPRLRLWGWQSADLVTERMKSAAYLLMPSLWYENFPRTLVEAYACGLPVIASRLGAMAELVREGQTGLLFDAGDARSLAAAMESAATNPLLMALMGRNARAEYEEKYTPERNLDQLVSIYRDSIDAQRRGQAA